MGTDEDVTCRELVELLTDYLEDALPDERRRAVDAHLSICEGCSIVLDQMKQTIELAGSISEEQLPEEQRQTLLAAFRDWRKRA